MVLLGDEAQVEACFGMFGDSVNLDARRCTFCAKCTTRLEIILDEPDGTLK
jgi:predicted Zn-dependent protease